MVSFHWSSSVIFITKITCYSHGFLLHIFSTWNLFRVIIDSRTRYRPQKNNNANRYQKYYSLVSDIFLAKRSIYSIRSSYGLTTLWILIPGYNSTCTAIRQFVNRRENNQNQLTRKYKETQYIIILKSLYMFHEASIITNCSVNQRARANKTFIYKYIQGRKKESGKAGGVEWVVII